MSKIVMLKGLPASGKSTYAKELVARGNWKRINKDELRAMLDSSKWSKGNEKFVLQARDMLIRGALSGGQNSVVVDDTNFAPSHEITMREIADEFKIPFEIKFFDVDPEECIERDLKRPVSVGSKVIMKMYNQYLKPAINKPVWDQTLPWAFICDIDGTLAHMTDRGPFDWKRVGEDEIDFAVSHVVETYSKVVNLILVSGRDAICRRETEEWLQAHGIWKYVLFMRPEGDMRKDTIVKDEIYEREIAGKYNIDFVLDDRDQVVKMWRSKGLQCFQVAEGDF